MKVNEWLNMNLKRNANDLRTQAARCRKVYTSEPMNGYCQTLADAYEEAAAAFEKRLATEVSK